ncbi:MAG: ABC transporter permease [bacterium]|nr:ABC transporter permease [bacterium]
MFIEPIQAVIRYRPLIQSLVIRELKSRYRGTFLGFLWSFMNPLLLMLVYSFVFYVYMRVEMPNYTAFLLCGLLPWIWFSTALTEATSSIINNAGLIRKVYLASEVFPTIHVLSNLINYLLSLPILFIFLFLYKIKFTLALIALPILILLQLLFTWGVALFVSSLGTKYRDLLHLVPNLLLLWFFATPIIYPIWQIPDKFKILLAWNPMLPLITGYQNILYAGTFPDWKSLFLFAGITMFVILFGTYTFTLRKERFAEEV